MKGNFSILLLISSATTSLINDDLGVLRLVMVRASVVNFVGLLVEYFELHKVEALLNQVNVAEVLEMQDELDNGAIRHVVNVSR